jgi:hypothetical protein
VFQVSRIKMRLSARLAPVHASQHQHADVLYDSANQGCPNPKDRHESHLQINDRDTRGAHGDQTVAIGPIAF